MDNVDEVWFTEDDIHLEIKNALDGGDVGLESLALVKFAWIAVNEETLACRRLLEHRLLEQCQHRLLHHPPTPTYLTVMSRRLHLKHRTTNKLTQI